MNMQEVRTLARHNFIDVTGLNRNEIIHALQRKEGNFDCYATAYGGECDQYECVWRKDCLKASAD